jgi:hypothetical protein
MNIILLLVQVKTLLSSVAFLHRKSLRPDWRRARRARVRDNMVAARHPLSLLKTRFESVSMVQPAKDRMRAERSVLCLKSALRLERRDQQGQEEA